jgi:hypothetical protein
MPIIKKFLLNHWNYWMKKLHLFQKRGRFVLVKCCEIIFERKYFYFNELRKIKKRNLRK